MENIMHKFLVKTFDHTTLVRKRVFRYLESITRRRRSIEMIAHLITKHKAGLLTTAQNLNKIVRINTQNGEF